MTSRRSRGDRYTSNVSVLSTGTSGTLEHGYSMHTSTYSLSSHNSMGTLSRAPIMQASEISNLLKRRLAFLSGGKDNQGRPIICFPDQQSEVSLEDVAAILSYLASIPSVESKRHGFTIIINMRVHTWQAINPLCRVIQESLPNQVHCVFIVKPDGVWERGKSSSLRRDGSHFEFEVVTVPDPSRLHKAINPAQLTAEFGGTLNFNNGDWIENRVDYEKFLVEVSNTQKRFDQMQDEINRFHEVPYTTEERLRWSKRIKENVVNQPSWVLQLGNALLTRLKDNSNPTEDQAHMSNQVEGFLKEIQERQTWMKSFLAKRDVPADVPMELNDLEFGIKKVVEWIIGAGEKLLASQKEIGTDFQTADQLRRDHEKFELKCMDTYGNYAELRHTSDEFIKSAHPKAHDIDVQKDYMDTVCRSFATRLERRRNIVICSSKFHRFAEDAFHAMDTLMQICKKDSTNKESIEEAQAALHTLNTNLEDAKIHTQKAIQEGYTLLEMLSLPIKNAFGRDITPNYAVQIKHIRDLIARLEGQRLHAEDLAKIRLLRLKQLIQLKTCERDAEQAILWLLELVEVLITQHFAIGEGLSEAEQLKRDNEKFGNTAADTYEYGKKLLQTSLMLRRTMELDLRPNYDKAQRLESAWRKFNMGLSERTHRLSVSIMFHRNIEKLIIDIDRFCQEVAPRVANSDPHVVEKVLGRYEPRRQTLLKEYHDTMGMGQALIDRIRLPLVAPERDNRTRNVPASQLEPQTEILSGKLTALSSEKREMDILWGVQDMPTTPDHMRASFRRKLPGWDAILQGQEGHPRGEPARIVVTSKDSHVVMQSQRVSGQGGQSDSKSPLTTVREPERVTVSQANQQHRMPPRQVQEPEFMVATDRAQQQFAAPTQQQNGKISPEEEARRNLKDLEDKIKQVYANGNSRQP